MPRNTNIPPKSVEQLAKEFAERLRIKRTMPPPSPEERQRARAERLMSRLQRTETALDRSDQRRLRDLLEYARVQADLGDLTAVYGACVEVCQMARTRLLGVRDAHPIAASTRPPSLPPVTTDEDSPEGDSEPP